MSTTNRPVDPTEALRAALAHHLEQTMALTDTERELARFHDTVRRRRPVARLVAAAAAVTLVAAGAAWGLLGVDRNVTLPGQVAVPTPSTAVELGPVAEVALPSGTVGVGMAQAGGSLWVLTAAGDLLEVDPRANRVVRQITPGGGVTGEIVAVGDDLWVGADRNGSRGYARIPAGASAADAFLATGAGPRQGGLPGHPLAFGPAGLWGTADDGRALVRMDPRSGKELSRSPLPFAAVSVEVGDDVVWAGAADGSTAVLTTATGTVGDGPPLKVGPIGPVGLIGRSAWIIDADSAALVRAETSCGCPITTQDLPDGVPSPPDAAGEVFGTDRQVHALYRTTSGWQLVRVDDISAAPSSRTSLGELVSKPLVVLAFDDVWVLRPDGSTLERVRT
ncbi:MAG: hypothetical protein LH469_14070 [Frankiaceae bacterium]|nr:hypothetical protein [Frankiaceae bacterium]